MYQPRCRPRPRQPPPPPRPPPPFFAYSSMGSTSDTGTSATAAEATASCPATAPTEHGEERAAVHRHLHSGRRLKRHLCPLVPASEPGPTSSSRRSKRLAADAPADHDPLAE